MDKKLIIALAVLIIVALAFLASVSQIPSQVSPPAETVTTEESSVLEDQIPAIVEEQLNALSVEDLSFLSDAQDSITSDTSMFYYE